MGISKVILDGKTLIDLTQDSIEPEKMLEGTKGHNRAGEEIGGAMLNRGSVAGTISKKTGAYIIAEGYHNGDGSVSIAEDERAKIIPGNIKSGIDILGVSGTYTGDGSSSAEVDKTGTGEYLWAVYDTKEKWDYTVKSISGTTKPSGYSNSQYNRHEITSDGYWQLGTKTGGTTSSDYYYLPENTQNGKAKSILKKSAYSYINPYSVLTVKDTANIIQGDNLLGYISSDTKETYPEKGIQDGKYYVRVVGADANVTASRMLSGNVGYTSKGKITGSIQSQAAQTITPGTADQTISSGKYLSGAQTIKGDANLLAENIKYGVSIFGVMGSLQVGDTEVDLENWNSVANGVATGAIQEKVSIGDEFENTWTDTAVSKAYNIPLRINHFEDVEIESGKTIKGMWLQMKYGTPFGVQMDQYEAFYSATSGLSAGTYNVKFLNTVGNIAVGSSYSFKLTKAVPSGGFLAGFRKAPNVSVSEWRVYSYNSDRKTIIETVTVSAGASGTNLGTMSLYGNDGSLNGILQTAYGSNRYSVSALRQWLNSDKKKGEWWEPKGKYDLAPDQLATKDGFLCGIDPELLAVMQPVKVVTHCNNVVSEYKNQKDITYDKVVLASPSQMYINSDTRADVPAYEDEGEAHEYYKQLKGTSEKFQPWSSYSELIMRGADDTNTAQHNMFRSAWEPHASWIWCVGSSGTVGYSDLGPCYENRVQPMMVIGKA